MHVHCTANTAHADIIDKDIAGLGEAELAMVSGYECLAKVTVVGLGDHEGSISALVAHVQEKLVLDTVGKEPLFL